MAYDYGEADIEPGDPTLAEIAAMCEAFQKEWPEWRRRGLPNCRVTVSDGEVTTVDVRVYTCDYKHSGVVVSQAKW